MFIHTEKTNMNGEENMTIPKWAIWLCGLLMLPILNWGFSVQSRIGALEIKQQVTEVNRAEIKLALADQTKEIKDMRLQIERLLSVSVKPSEMLKKLEEIENKINKN